MHLMNPRVVVFTCMPIKHDTCPRVVGFAFLTEKPSHQQRPAVSSDRRTPVLDASQVDHFPSNPTLYYFLFFPSRSPCHSNDYSGNKKTVANLLVHEVCHIVYVVPEGLKSREMQQA